MIETPGSLIFRYEPVLASSERQKQLFVAYSALDVVYLCCEKAAEAGAAIPFPPAQSISRVLSVRILSSVPCKRLTRPCSVPGDFLHACRAAVCTLGSPKAGGEGALTQCRLPGLTAHCSPAAGT